MKHVVVYNPETKQRQTIPISELSSSMLPVKLEDESGVWVDTRKIIVNREPKHPPFSDTRRAVLKKIQKTLAEVYTCDLKSWEYGLRCDEHPGREIRHWRWIAYTYGKLIANGACSLKKKLDLFRICLRWTLFKDTDAVLATVDLEEISQDAARNVIRDFNRIDPDFFRRSDTSTLSTIIDYSSIKSLEEFEAISSQSDVILAIDWNTGDTQCVYGRSILEEIDRSGVGRRLQVAAFAVDFSTDEIEHFLAAVKVTRGHYDE